MKSALAALKFLTIANRMDEIGSNPQLIGQGALYFPLVGFTFGLILASLNHALEPYLASEVLAVFLVTALIIMSGAVQLEGTQKTFDRWSAPGTPPSEDHQGIGVNGLLILLLIVIFKVRAVEVVGEARHLSLLLAPVMARWSLVTFLYGTLAPADQATRLMAEEIRAWQLFLTTAATLALAIFLVGRAGLWIAFGLSLFAILARNYLERRRGGLTRDHLGPIVELSETATLIFFASF